MADWLKQHFRVYLNEGLWRDAEVNRDGILIPLDLSWMDLGAKKRKVY